MANEPLPPPATFRQLIDLFGSKAEFARRVGRAPDQGRIWYRRDRVPRNLKTAVLALCDVENIPFGAAHFDALSRAGDLHDGD